MNLSQDYGYISNLSKTVSQSAENQSNCLGRTNNVAHYSLFSTVVLIILTTIFCLVAFVGNVLVIIAIVKDHIISKHKQHLYLLSLAVADALLVVLVVPFSLTNELLGRWPFGRIYCRIYLSVDILLCTASICNICFIGIERFVSVKYPTKYKKHRRLSRIRRAIIFVWIYAAAVSLLPFTTKTETINDVREECFINDSTWFILLSSSLSFLLPTCVIGPVYFNIFLIGRRLAVNREERNKRAYTKAASASLDCGTLLLKRNKPGHPYQKKNSPGNCDVTPQADKPSPNSTQKHYTTTPDLAACRNGFNPAADNGKSYFDKSQENPKVWRHGDYLHAPAFLKHVKTQLPEPSDNRTDGDVFPDCRAASAVAPSYQTNLEPSNCKAPPLHCQSVSGPILYRSRSVIESTAKANNFANWITSCCLKLCSRVNDNGSTAPPDGNKKSNMPPQKSPAISFCCFQRTRSNSSALVKRANALSTIKHLGTSRREARFIFIILVVTGFFILCWTPFFTTYVIYTLCGEMCCIDQTMFKVFFWIGYLNSAANPVLYTIFNKDFRQAFKRLFTSRTWSR